MIPLHNRKVSYILLVWLLFEWSLCANLSFTLVFIDISLSLHIFNQKNHQFTFHQSISCRNVSINKPFVWFCCFCVRINLIFIMYLLSGPSLSISPFIYHWEPAKYNKNTLERAHEHHELQRRRKRSINYNHHSADYGPANVIRLNFFAHDR